MAMFKYQLDKALDIIKKFKEKEVIEEVTLTSKETGFKYDIEFASRPTDHFRIKIINRNKQPIVSIGYHNKSDKIELFHETKEFNKLKKNEKEKIYTFVKMNWDIIVESYYKRIDQDVAKSTILNRLQEYNNKCIQDNREDDILW